MTEIPMAIPSRRTLQAFVVGGLLFVCPALFASFSSSSSVSASSCAALQAWAQPFAGTAPTLDELARYDRAHRRAIFNAIAPDVRAALWREQITRFGARAELSPQQHALTTEAAGLLTPALYRRDAAARQAFETFWRRASTDFSDTLSQRAWSDLGALATSAAAVRATDTTWCECKIGGGTGQCGGTSCGDPGGCTQIGGCGISGLQTCNGMCQ
jgi:hypothetical protein